MTLQAKTRFQQLRVAVLSEGSIESGRAKKRLRTNQLHELNAVCRAPIFSKNSKADASVKRRVKLAASNIDASGFIVAKPSGAPRALHAVSIVRKKEDSACHGVELCTKQGALAMLCDYSDDDDND